jgi:hypothetical protein
VAGSALFWNVTSPAAYATIMSASLRDHELGEQKIIVKGNISPATNVSKSPCSCVQSLPSRVRSASSVARTLRDDFFLADESVGDA